MKKGRKIALVAVIALLVIAAAWYQFGGHPKGARWEASMPPAVAFDGPVMRVTDQMNAALAK